jgi:hypothetical protein
MKICGGKKEKREKLGRDKNKVCGGLQLDNYYSSLLPSVFE